MPIYFSVHTFETNRSGNRATYTVTAVPFGGESGASLSLASMPVCRAPPSPVAQNPVKASLPPACWAFEQGRFPYLPEPRVSNSNASGVQAEAVSWESRCHF